MKKLVVLATLLFAQPIFACQFNTTFDPPRPTDRDDIEISISGRCGDACVPHDPTFHISGDRITINFQSHPGCILVPTEWGERVRVGRLLAGTYEIVMRFEDDTAAIRTLVVETAPFTVAPTFGPAGTNVVIRGLDLGVCTKMPCIPPVYFGGIVVAGREVGDTIIATAPPRAPGLYDIAVEDYSKKLHTLRNAYRYTVSRTGPEADFERVMFPLNYDGPGAHGAEWRTRITVRNDAPVETWTEPTLKDPFLSPGERATFPTEPRDGGAFLYIPRRLEPHLVYASHIFDASRMQSTIGTEMPVVRAEDTAHEIELLNVRVGEGYRALLRIYDFDATPLRDVNVIISRAEPPVIFRQVRLSPGIVCLVPPCRQPGPTFAALDLSAIPEVQSESGVDVTITALTNDARLWAFVSVTNNETQQVTLWTPQ